MTLKPISKQNRMNINYNLSHKTLWSKFTGLEWIQSRKNQKKLQHLSASTCSFTEALPSMSCTTVTLSSWFREVEQVSRTDDHWNKHTLAHTHRHTNTHQLPTRHPDLKFIICLAGPPQSQSHPPSCCSLKPRWQLGRWGESVSSEGLERSLVPPAMMWAPWVRLSMTGSFLASG